MNNKLSAAALVLVVLCAGLFIWKQISPESFIFNRSAKVESNGTDLNTPGAKKFQSDAKDIRKYIKANIPAEIYNKKISIDFPKGGNIIESCKLLSEKVEHPVQYNGKDEPLNGAPSFGNALVMDVLASFAASNSLQVTYSNGTIILSKL